MNWEALSAVAEFVGGAAVVVSLVYLALQARQSAQLERSENYGRVVDTVAGLLSNISSNRNVADLMIAGSTDLERLDTSDRVRFAFLMYEIFGNYEFIYEQHQQKALPSHVWPHYKQHIEFWSSLPGVRKWWTARKAIFSEGFMDVAGPFFAKPGLTVEDATEMWANW